MLTNEIIRLQAEAQQDYVIESRRTIHRFAEVSGKEFKTSCFIEEEVKKAGLPYEKSRCTGWFAILDTGSQDHVLRSGQILMRFWYRRSQITLQVLVL